MEILDSGARRQFDSGAVRDIADGKGRCDLLPIDTIAVMMPNQEYANILHHISGFMKAGYTEDLYRGLYIFAELQDWTIPEMIMEVSHQYEEGCVKYGERNWEKGIPLHCYIDSGIRHLLKCIDEWDDEPHARAFVWNMLGAIWTVNNLPAMIDVPFPERMEPDDNTSVSEDDTSAEDNYIPMPGDDNFGCGGDESTERLLDDDTVTVSRSKLESFLDDVATVFGTEN